MLMSDVAAVAGAAWFSSSQALAIRWCITQGYKIDPTRLVLAAELLKIASVVVIVKCVLKRPVFPGPWRHGFALCTVLYMGTNLLEYVILQHTSIGTYMVLIQHKALTIMALSTGVLGKQYAAKEWAACLLLIIGVVCTHGGAGEYAVSFLATVLIVVQGS